MDKLSLTTIVALLSDLVAATRSVPQAADRLNAAIARTQHIVPYGASYYAIPYPNGDVPGYTEIFQAIPQGLE